MPNDNFYIPKILENRLPWMSGIVLLIAGNLKVLHIDYLGLWCKRKSLLPLQEIIFRRDLQVGRPDHRGRTKH